MASSKSLLNSFQETLKRREAKSSRRRLTVLPQGSVDFSSNDFLSLSSSSAFRTRFLHHINSAPASQPLASGGSRLLDGNSHYAEDLERFIAGFHDAPSGLLFNSGYDANVGVFSCIPQPKDVILYDELIHASIHEGMRLSRAAKRIKFPHNSPSGLKEVLQKQVQDDQEILKGTRNVFIAIETVYSMDGDIAPVKEFIQVVRDLLPQGNGYFIVDEAHATGVFGPHGAGVIQDLGVQEHIFIRVHTFGKALASHGGTILASITQIFLCILIPNIAIVLCDPLTRDYLINYARSLIYTTAAAFPSLVSIRTAYELLQEGETDSVSSQYLKCTPDLLTYTSFEKISNT